MNDFFFEYIPDLDCYLVGPAIADELHQAMTLIEQADLLEIEFEGFSYTKIPVALLYRLLKP